MKQPLNMTTAGEIFIHYYQTIKILEVLDSFRLNSGKKQIYRGGLTASFIATARIACRRLIKAARRDIS